MHKYNIKGVWNIKTAELSRILKEENLFVGSCIIEDSMEENGVIENEDYQFINPSEEIKHWNYELQSDKKNHLGFGFYLRSIFDLRTSI
ncbi:MAG: hypothetical protein R3F48_12625 [Candidatus Zixiibacteriota bacterium]